jgi:asparagine synthetase B (glutamine-hydrolysing)
LSAGIAAAVPAGNRFLRWPRWIASLSAHRQSEIAGFTRVPLERSNSPRSLTLYCATEDQPDFAVAGNRTVVFEGVLYNAERLASRFGLEGRADDYGAILLRAYERMGEAFLGELRGIYALVMWDGDRDTLIVARDRTGAHPCFYARAGEALLIASSIDTLLEHPGVSTQVNRAAFVDFLADSWPSLRETFYAAVNRVPPGSALRVRGADEAIYRYWNPRIVESASDWLDEREADGFEDLLVAAVDRFMKCGPSGIFLSGGLDSVSVAAIATDLASREGFTRPLALSMAFRNSEADEEQRQRAVARQLGLEQKFLGFQDETGGQGFLRPTLMLAERMSAPLLNMWLARYGQLTEIGKRHGCRAILTGTGGDEWLGVAPMLAADMIRGLDFAGLYRLWVMTHNSYQGSWLKQLRLWGWRCGVRAIVRDATISGLKRVSPATLAAVRRWRLINSMPAWITLDRSLRRELGDRIEKNETSRTREPGLYGNYFAESRLVLDHPVVSWELEETFENGRRLGVRFFHPYWDSDLVDLLWRTPPSLLAAGGRMKGLVRKVVSRRFPALGFDQQKKVEVRGLFFSIMADEAPALWKESGGAKSLAELGLVDRELLDREFHQALGARFGTHAQACMLFNIMNMESWLRKRL